ncbi:transcription termination/antitermination NusG family protein [Confluentibacter sediminis]|uniref:transcription termination/antitermination NusG family protein n=1 Tax=Confluentibacter sediminis TaxID=2219045 RepID=UPI000DAC454B|nr:transcription termination/antitermination NusG family protein [Confluentibacter sediminis]
MSLVNKEKSNLNWHVLYVRAKQEFKIEDHINNSDFDIEAFCPSRIETRIWSDRKKKVSVPILPSIILIKTQESLRDKVFSIPGTIRYLFWLGKPAIVKETEIEQLRFVSQHKDIVSHEVEVLKPGKTINLKPFGFSDANGIIEKVSNNVCWIILETLGFTIKVTLK